MCMCAIWQRANCAKSIEFQTNGNYHCSVFNKNQSITCWSFIFCDVKLLFFACQFRLVLLFRDAMLQNCSYYNQSRIMLQLCRAFLIMRTKRKIGRNQNVSEFCLSKHKQHTFQVILDPPLWSTPSVTFFKNWLYISIAYSLKIIILQN